MPDYGSFISSNIDSVNLSNGGVSVRIPIISRKGRGVDFSYTIGYESKLWVVDSYVVTIPGKAPVTHYHWRPDTTNANWIELRSDTAAGFGTSHVNWTEQLYTCSPWPDPTSQPAQVGVRSNWMYKDNEGVQYQFPNRKLYDVFDENRCVDPVAFMSQQMIGQSDSSQLQLDITNDPWGGLNAVVLSRGRAIAGANDTNGNVIGGTQPNGWVLDSLGRPVLSGAFSPNNTSISYYDSNGQVQPVTFQWISIQPNTSFPTAEDPSGLWVFDTNYTFAFKVLQSITLQNGLKYTFSYNDPNNPAQTNPYSELTQISLPTGGWIKYKWATIAQIDPGPTDAASGGTVVTLDRRALVERDVSPDGVNVYVWQYSYAPNQTTVTDPLGNVQVHTFSDVCGQPQGSVRETEVEYRQGATTPLKRIQTNWACDSGPVYATQLGGGVDQFNFDTVGSRSPRVVRTTTTLVDTNQVSKTETDYNDTFTYTGIDGKSYTDNRGNPTQIREYDYGSGTPGPLTRYTNFSYLHNSNSNYLNAHIWDRVTQKSVYDASNNLKSSTQYAYDTTAITSTSGVPEHDYTNYPATYTIRGNITQVQKWSSTTSSWLTTTNYYNDVGNLIETTDPLNNNTFFSYADNFGDGVNRNSQGYLTQVSYPTTNGVAHLAGKQYFWYTGLAAAQCGQNAPSPGSCTNTYSPTISSPVSDYAKFTFDLLGRPVSVTRGDSGVTTFTYNEATLPISVVSSDSLTSSQTIQKTAILDGLGRVSQLQLNSDPSGVVYTDYTYDGLGRRSTVSNPYRSTSDPTYGITSFGYDGLGRVSQVTDADGSVVGTSYSGNCATATDEQGKTRESCSDALGRLTKVIENPGGLNYETDYTYDVLDDLIGVVQSGSRNRSFTYDSLSRLAQAVNPESGTVNYSYDANGNVSSKVSPAPNQTGSSTVTTTYTYDALNRLTKKQFSDTTPTVFYNYDGATQTGCTAAIADSNPKGSRTGMCDAAGSESWSHDSMGRTLTDRRTTNSVTKNLTYTYAPNLDGSINSLTYPSGLVVTYGYDAAGRQISASDQHGDIYASAGTYAPQGALATATLGATAAFPGFSLSNGYTKRLQTNEIKVTNSGTTVMDYSYCFYALNSGACPATGTTNNGNVMGILSNVDTTRSQTFTYDALNRIATAGTVNLSGTHCWDEKYGYDAWGNLLSIGAVSGYSGCTLPDNLNLSVTANNQISGYTYDAAGNLITIPGTGGATYTYNSDGELTTSSAGATYTYDGDGNRVEKSSGTLYWYGMGSDVLEKTGLTGSVQADFVFFDGQRIGSRNSSSTVTYFNDHLGSARMSAAVSTGGSTATIQWDADYYPFGRIKSYVSSSAPAFRFTGKELDTETGLDNFGARYYSSTLGRFMTVDPSRLSVKPGNPQTWNRYAYAQNSPLGYVDPNGRWTTEIHNMIIDQAFPGLSQQQRETLKNSSYWMDHCASCQSKSHDHEHYMKRPGEDATKAKEAALDFINKQEKAAQKDQGGIPDKAAGINDKALTDFGKALHTATDGTSPAHVDQNGNPRDWNGLPDPVSPGDWHAVGQHKAEESSPTAAQLEIAIIAAQQAFRNTFGDAAFQDATTIPNSDNSKNKGKDDKQKEAPGGP